MKFSFKKLNESIKDKLSDIKDKDNQNKIDKIKSLMGVLEDEGKAFQGLAKAAKDAFTEHDYDKLKAEADRFEQMAKDSEAKYKKLEAELKKLEGEKKSEKKEDKKEDKKELNEGVWSVLPKRIPEFIRAVENLKDEYHNVVGSDAVFDGLDSAIIEAERLLANSSKMKEGIHDRDILSRPLSNPDVKPLNRSSEELGKEADSRSENMLRMKYQKQIADPKISDDELRYLLGGSGEKAFGGRPNAIEKIIKNRNGLGKNLNERDMSKKEEKIVLKLKKSKGDFKKRYGKDAEKVMYATATKLANK